LSLFFLGRAFFAGQRERLFFLVLAFYPATFLFIGIVWKDVSMLVAIVMSISLLFIYEDHKNILTLLVSLIFFVYGVSVRHNAIFCALPFFLYLFALHLGPQWRYRKTVAIFLTLAVIVLLHSFANFISTYKIHPAYRSHHIENSIFIWDLWGMSVRLDKNLLPDYVFQDNGEEVDIDFLKEHYKPHTNTVVWLHEQLNRDWRKKNFPDEEFKRDFFAAIADYPGTYLKTRFDIMPYMLGIKKTYIYMPYFFHIQKFDQSHYLHKYSSALRTKDFWFKRKVNQCANFLYHNTIIFDVWPYLILGVVQMLYFCYDTSQPHSKRALVILSIGFIYWLPYFFITTSSEFRYSSLTVFCTLITLPLFCSAVGKKIAAPSRQAEFASGNGNE
jgi:hypothetical protein